LLSYSYSYKLCTWSKVKQQLSNERQKIYGDPKSSLGTRILRRISVRYNRVRHYLGAQIKMKKEIKPRTGGAALLKAHGPKYFSELVKKRWAKEKHGKHSRRISK